MTTQEIVLAGLTAILSVGGFACSDESKTDNSEDSELSTDTEIDTNISEDSDADVDGDSDADNDPGCVLGNNLLPEFRIIAEWSTDGSPYLDVYRWHVPGKPLFHLLEHTISGNRATPLKVNKVNCFSFNCTGRCAHGNRC